MPTLQELLASPYNPRDPYRGSQLQDLQAASMQTRNQALQSILGQYKRPMTNVYEAGGVDSLVKQLREGRQSRLEGLAQRGLANSGAAATSERSLRDLYSRGLLDVALNANNQEQSRKQGLSNQLMNLLSTDVDFQQALADARLQQTQAGFATNQTELAKNLDLAHGSAILASILVGGALGAAGGAAGGTVGGASGVSGGAAAGQAGGLAGAGAGALGGANYANQFGGGGNAGQQAPIDVASPSSYGGRPVTTNPYGFNIGQDYMRTQIAQNPEFSALLYRNRY